MNLEGAFLPAGPMRVAAQLPDGNPIKKLPLAYIATDEGAHGKDSVAAFGGHAWDTGQLLQKAVPAALKKAQPGAKEFRAAVLTYPEPAGFARGTRNPRPQGWGRDGRAMGVDTARSKVVIILIAASFACVSVWLYAHLQRFVNPTPFGLHVGIEYLFMAVVGGSGHVWGALHGAGVITVLKQWLQDWLPNLPGTSI